MIAAKEDLEVEFKCQIDLKLTVKVKEDMHRFHKEDL